MTYTTARWVSDDQTSIIVATSDGREFCVPVDLGNRHYRELISQGLAIDPPL